MEDQRAALIWWENEMRSGRDPNKGCGCPMDRSTVLPPFRPACFQPIPKKDLTDILIEITTQHFGIESEKEKCNLKIMFDAYAQCKMKESIAKAFSDFAKEDKRK